MHVFQINFLMKLYNTDQIKSNMLEKLTFNPISFPIHDLKTRLSFELYLTFPV